MKVLYLAELIFPSKKAYAIHVMKMCNALSKKNNIQLIIFKNNEKNIFKTYNCESKFSINELKLNKINFINRLKFTFGLLKYINSKKILIISRSVLGALYLSLKGYNVVLEIHHELSSFTKYIFNISKYCNFFKKIKFIFISKELVKKYSINNKSIILDDAVDLIDFKKSSNSTKFKNTCCYTGSFAKGKGLEKIFEISKKLKKIKFHIYGDFSNSEYSINDFKKYKNVIYKGYIKYSKIPNVLKRYEVVLMPYSNTVFGRGKNLEIGKYMSPMKLFDYLASGSIIIASKLKVYGHILNNRNSILVEEDKIEQWADQINLVFNNLKKFKYLKKNSKLIIKNYSWDIRAKKIIEFVNV